MPNFAYKAMSLVTFFPDAQYDLVFPSHSSRIGPQRNNPDASEDCNTGMISGNVRLLISYYAFCLHRAMLVTDAHVMKCQITNEEFPLSVAAGMQFCFCTHICVGARCLTAWTKCCFVVLRFGYLCLSHKGYVCQSLSGPLPFA